MKLSIDTKMVNKMMANGTWVIYGAIVAMADDDGYAITSLRCLAKMCHCPLSTTRRYLMAMSEDGIIAFTSTCQNTEIWLLSWPRRQAATKKPETTEDLISQMRKYIDKYDRNMLNAFYSYWTEKSKNGTMRYKREHFFEVGKRLETWARMDKNNNTNGTKKYGDDGQQQRREELLKAMRELE